jgi:hypothetical protein
MGFKKFAVILAFLGGSIIVKFCSMIVDKFLCYLFNMKSLGPLDELFVHDDENCLSNVGVLFSTEKFSYEMMNDYLKKSFFGHIQHATRI